MEQKKIIKKNYRSLLTKCSNCARKYYYFTVSKYGQSSTALLGLLNSSLKKHRFFWQKQFDLFSCIKNREQTSGSQTFPLRGPLKIFQWSAKPKILIYIGIGGPLELISRTTSGPRSRLWETLEQTFAYIFKSESYLICDFVTFRAALKMC